MHLAKNKETLNRTFGGKLADNIDYPYFSKPVLTTEAEFCLTPPLLRQLIRGLLTRQAFPRHEKVRQ